MAASVSSFRGGFLDLGWKGIDLQAILLALLPLIGKLGDGFKTWADYKQNQITLKQQYDLAALKAQSDQIIAEAQSSTTSLQAALQSTTQEFKQMTFWLIWLPIAFTMLFPEWAAVAWKNFTTVPPMFQELFRMMYYVIWGVPFIKGGYAMFSSYNAGRREYVVEKAKVFNETKLFDSLRKSIFTNGLTPKQVSAVQEALKAGQEP